LVTNEVEALDMLWYGAYPPLLADHCGVDAEAMIERIESAVAAYPWRFAPPLIGPQQQHLCGLGGPPGACAALKSATLGNRQGLSSARLPSSTTRQAARAGRNRCWGWPA
jgi:hypothetical protein